MAHEVKRRRLSIKEKKNLIEDVIVNGMKSSDAAIKYGCSRPGVSIIIKNRQRIEATVNGTVKSTKKSDYGKLDLALKEWFDNNAANKIPVNGPMLLQKANDFAKMLQIKFRRDDKTLSMGYVNKFIKRFNIRMCKKNVGGSDVDIGIVDMWKRKLGDILKQYDANDIYNWDETGLFWRKLPDGSYINSGDPRIGGKVSNERVTILLMSNMSGSDHNFAIIGQAAKPPAFKANNFTVPKNYYHDSDACMTRLIFEDLLKKFNKRLKKENRVSVLFLDNVSAHKTEKTFTNVLLEYFPENTTAVTQPQNQGIIQNFKINYTRKFLSILSANLENFGTYSPNNISIYDSYHIIKDSMAEVEQQTIQNCFQKAGFYFQTTINGSNTSDSSVLDVNCHDRELNLVWQTVVEQMRARNISVYYASAMDFVAIDRDEVTSQIPSDEAIIERVRVQTIEDEGGDEELVKEKVPSLQEANVALRVLTQYVRNQKNNDKMMDMIREMETALIDHHFKMKAKASLR